MDIQSLSNSAFSVATTQRPQNVVSDTTGSPPASNVIAQPNAPTDTLASAQNDLSSREQLKSAVQATKDFVGTVNSSLEFSVDEGSGKSVVKIIDKDTKELIRQIPSEEMLSIAKALDTIKGLLFRQKA